MSFITFSRRRLSLAQKAMDRVNWTDDGNTIGCVAERKDPGRVGYNLPRGPAFFGVFSFQRPAFTLMKSASEAPLSVTMARRAITTDMAKARIKGHQ